MRLEHKKKDGDVEGNTSRKKGKEKGTQEGRRGKRRKHNNFSVIFTAHGGSNISVEWWIASTG